MTTSKILRRGAIGLGIVAIPALLGSIFIRQIVMLALSLAVSRYPHGTIELVAFDGGGRRLSSAEFSREWFPTLIVRDHSGAPCFGLPYGIGAPRVAVPPGELVSLDLLWPVPGFGKTMLTADNGGPGYFVREGDSLSVELTWALAQTRIEALQEWIRTHHHGGAVTPTIAAKIYIAAGMIYSRQPDVVERARTASSALRIAIEASEDEVLGEAAESIRMNRRTSLQIKVVDSRGMPVSSAMIHVSEIRPDFLFGVFNGGYDADTVSRLRWLGLDYATLHLNWNQVEPQADAYNFAATDASFQSDLLLREGFTLRGHALVWFMPMVMPAYMKPLRGKPETLSLKVREHVAHITGHFGDRVSIWEANNEGHAAWASWGLSRAGMDTVVRAAADELRKDAPGRPILINLADPLGETVALKYYPIIPGLSGGMISDFAIDPYLYIEELQHAGVEFDQVGLQMYYGGKLAPQFGGLEQPAIDLFRFASVLDRYEHLGRPISVTEVSVGSQDTGTRSWWHARPSETTQADWLAGVFTLAYGDPHVVGINWWDLYDAHSFIDGGGLMDAAGHPKRSYNRLHELLAGWRSEGEITSGADGTARFEGYSGDYTLQAFSGKRRGSATMRAEQGKNNHAIIRLNDG